jgi:hypothetical protein
MHGKATNRNTDESAIDAKLFSRYAGTDLDRWRTLIGQEVVHVDPRWGGGRVEDVRWGTCCDHVPPTIQVRVRSARHGLVVFRAASFAAHHRSVTVSQEVRRVIRACFEEGASDARRRALLERHTRELREASDRERLRRAEALKRRVVDRRRSGT